MRDSTFSIDKRMAFFLFALAIALVAINVILIKKNRELSNSLSKCEAPEIPPGTIISSLKGLDADGRVLAFDLHANTRRTVLLVFSPTCTFCIKNMPMWSHLLKTIDKNSYQVIAVSIKREGTKEYIAEYGLSSIPVIAELSVEDSLAYNFNATPMTVLISSDGKVEKSWAGLLSKQAQDEMKRSLGLPLLISRLRGHEGLSSGTPMVEPAHR